MRSAVLCGLEFLGAVAVLIGAALWARLGGDPPYRGELVVDPDIDFNDAGIDVDKVRA